MPLNAAAIMSRQVITAQLEDNVRVVAQLLTDHGISAVPVCDGQGHVAGMLSEGDLIKPFTAQNALHRDWWLSLLAEGSDLAPAFLDYIRLDRRCAADLMSKPVIAARETASLSELAQLLDQHRIKRVPILRDGKLVGIVSRADLVKAIPEAVLET